MISCDCLCVCLKREKQANWLPSTQCAFLLLPLPTKKRKKIYILMHPAFLSYPIPFHANRRYSILRLFYSMFRRPDGGGLPTDGVVGCPESQAAEGGQSDANQRTTHQGHVLVRRGTILVHAYSRMLHTTTCIFFVYVHAPCSCMCVCAVAVHLQAIY